MPYIRRHRRGNNRYHALVEAQGRRQQQLQWLGTYDNARAKLEKSGFPDKREYLIQLARLEGRYSLKDSPELPHQRYQALYIDPPWAHRRNQGQYQTRRNMPDYPRMTCEDLVELQIVELAETNAYLWLWTPNSHLGEACKLIEQWGFELKTMFTWVKVCKRDRHKVRLGMGDWGRNATEQLILAVKGKPKSFGDRGLQTVLSQKCRSGRLRGRLPRSIYQ